MRWLFLSLIGIPIIEIIIFVLLGNSLGAWWVIGLILLTALIGITLARHQGIETWRRAQQSMQYGEYPTKYMIDGLCILIGAFLLIVPGLFTDAIGFILLIPFTRSVVKQYIIRLLQYLFSRGTFIYWRR